jgi:hypothetical protein
MVFCTDCVDGKNELTWRNENGEIESMIADCGTCNGTGEEVSE